MRLSIFMFVHILMRKNADVRKLKLDYFEGSERLPLGLV